MEYGQGVGLGYRWRVEEWRCGRERHSLRVVLLYAVHCCGGHYYFGRVSGVEDGLARSLQVSALLIAGRDLILGASLDGRSEAHKKSAIDRTHGPCLALLSRECLGDRR